MTDEAQPRSSILQRITSFITANGTAPVDQRTNRQELNQTQIYYSTLTRQFALTLSLASIIASLGLLANSTVAIVGAMLIAPLMKPIMSLSYGLARADWRMNLRSIITLSAGVILTVLVAMLTETVIDLHEPTTQIMLRTQPSLIDLGIAIAAGVAAALATTHRNVADTLPGVAISVSLVPPLCVTGISLSIEAWELSMGSAMLFAVNLVAIVLSAMIVFVAEGYGLVKRGLIGFAAVLIFIGLLLFPLSKALDVLRADDIAQGVVEQYLQEQFQVNKTVHPNDLSRLITTLMPDHVVVFLEVDSPAWAMTEVEARQIHQRLETAFEKPVNFKMQLLLTREIRIYEHAVPEGAAEYGLKDLVPRR